MQEGQKEKVTIYNCRLREEILCLIRELFTAVYLLFIYNLIQLHHEKECPAYPVVCDECNKDGIPRTKVFRQILVPSLSGTALCPHHLRHRLIVD